MAPSRDDILRFLRGHSLAAQASVSLADSPQASAVGFIVTDDFEMFFDALDTARKIQNLRQNPKIAFVIGGLQEGEERTVQYEGFAEEPRGDVLARLQEQYFARFPEGRERQSWPGITYVRVRPRWLRFSDFSQRPPEIVEFVF